MDFNLPSFNFMDPCLPFILPYLSIYKKTSSKGSKRQSEIGILY